MSCTCVAQNKHKCAIGCSCQIVRVVGCPVCVLTRQCVLNLKLMLQYCVLSRYLFVCVHDCSFSKVLAGHVTADKLSLFEIIFIKTPNKLFMWLNCFSVSLKCNFSVKIFGVCEIICIFAL
jgi:hypothetical protein